jgi:putative membrane protein
VEARAAPAVRVAAIDGITTMTRSAAGVSPAADSAVEDSEAAAAASAAAGLPEIGEMKNNLSVQDRQQISAAIAAFENRTSGELVGVIARCSDDYLYIPILWAALIALILPAFYFTMHWPIDYFRVYELQLAVFASLALLFGVSPLKTKLIPQGVKKTRAARLARQEFLTLGLHTTTNRAAILIFVSLAEHYVEILADAGIHEKVAPSQWKYIVNDVIRSAKEGRLAEGLLNAIQCCGDLLETHFPPEEGDQNQLPNELIEL